MVLAMADLDDALAIYDDALTEAHRRGSIIAFATTKTFRAQAYVLRGDLAEAEGREAFAAAEAWGAATTRASVYLAAILAEALMERGKLGDARTALKRSALGESLPKDARLFFLPNIRARLRILNGDLAGGLEDMLDTGRQSDALGGRNPAFMAWRSPAALALLQLGDRADLAAGPCDPPRPR
jgi:ATP/maltotriose-dependent transcriptional regulator MalT